MLLQIAAPLFCQPMDGTNRDGALDFSGTTTGNVRLHPTRRVRCALATANSKLLLRLQHQVQSLQIGLHALLSRCCTTRWSTLDRVPSEREESSL